jgi:ribosomal protein S18 acetylase RimI-like enzyme
MLYNLNKFYKSKKIEIEKYKFIATYCNNINTEYLQRICEDKNNKIYLYTINQTLNVNYMDEIIGIAIIRTILKNKSKTRIYIPLISVHKDMRNYGYGNIIMNEIKNKYNNLILEIVLLSLKSSYDFYKKIGFIKSRVHYIKQNETIGSCIMMKNIYYN